MIKRALALLLLLGAGFVLLQLAIGDAALGSFEGARRGDPRKDAESRPASEPGSRSRLQGGARRGGAEQGHEQSIRPVIAGALDVKRQREVPLPGGGWIVLPVYQLLAENSKPLADDRYRLEGVTVRFFEQAGTTEAPVPRLSGELRASTLLVTLGRDPKSGGPSLREDKEMELFDAVLTTSETARAKDVRLVLGHAFVLAEAAGTQLRSAGDDQPFELRRPGEHDVTLTGKGAYAWLPAARDPEQTANPSGRRLLQLRAKSEPVLQVVGNGAKSTLSAKGPLWYEEDLDGGGAHVLLEQQVRLHDEAHEADASGDRLEGWLVRAANAQPKPAAAQPTSRKSDSGGAIVWRRIELRGDPCEVVAQGAHVTSQRVDLLPSASGAPWFMVASGGKPRLVRAERGRTIKVDARDGIRLVRLRELFGGMHAAVGMPEAALGAGSAELAWFDGPTTISVATTDTGAVEGELTLVADEGASLLRGVAAASPVVLVGRGSVELRRKIPDQGELVLLGDQGLRVATSGDDVLLRLDSDQQQVDATLPPNSLKSVRSLTVRMRGNELESLDATGDACRLRMETKRGIVRGTAARILAEDPDSFTLLGTKERPAHLERTETETLDAPEITIGQVTGKISILEARGGARLHFDQSELARERDKDTKAEPGDLQAERILLMPYLVPSEIRGLYGSPLGAAAGRLFAASLGTTWLFADGKVVLVRKGLHAAKATGDHLVLRVDPDAPEGLLTGEPAKIEALDEHGQENLGAARVIRMRQAGQDLVLRLMPVGESLARLEVGNKEMPGSAEKKQGRLEVVCNGEIVITNARITFERGGRARSLLPSGEPDPAGMSLSSRELSIDRDEKNGQIKRLFARGDVVIVSKQLLARSDEASLDPITKWCTLSDTRTRNSFVTIKMNGIEMEGSRIEVNWETGAHRIWRYSVERGAR